MPLYEYQCTHCGKTFEILQKVNETPAVTCQECGKDQLQKKVSATRFQLKGTGWYVTDFKNKPETKAPETKPSETKTTENKSPESEAPKKTSGEESS